MNKVILMGRLTRDPEVRYSNSQSGEQLAIARYTIAVDRRFARRNAGNPADQQTADFISCVAFGSNAEFAEKYLKQGTKICVRGRIQTGSYTNKDGQKVYTTEVVIEQAEFAESKKAAEGNGGAAPADHYAPANGESVPATGDEEGYMDIDDADDLPFKK